MSGSTQPIGIFDSGIGGLTVAAAIRQALPHERLLYFGDTKHLPYGERSLEEVRAFSTAIARALMAKGCTLIVIACNTASAAALRSLREEFPHIAFVGMEPAVKPAAELSLTKNVGVLATTATFQGELFASVVERFAQGVNVIQQPCPGLVQAIEAGDFDASSTEKMLRAWIEPMLLRNIDALVLACTHYPIVRPLIERICGPSVRVIDPAPAVARRVASMLEERDGAAPSDQRGSLMCTTSGDPRAFRAMLDRLQLPSDDVKQARWNNEMLSLP